MKDIRRKPIEELAGLLRLPHHGLALNEQYRKDGAIICKHICALGCECIVSKRSVQTTVPAGFLIGLKLKPNGAGRETGAGGGLEMNRLFYGLMAGIVLLANPALAGGPVLVDGNGHALVFETTSRLQKEWNAYVKVHGIKKGGYIYTPYSAKFRRGGIHCDDTGTNTSPACDVEDTTIYGGS